MNRPQHLPQDAAFTQLSEQAAIRDLQEIIDGVALPGRNLLEQATWLLNLVSQTNEIPQAAPQRVAQLTQIHTVLERILPGLRKSSQAMTGSASEAKLRIARIIPKLYGALALGYQHAVSSLLSQQQPSTATSNQALDQALGGVIYCRSNEIYSSFCIHEAVPVGSWGRLHSAYRICESLRLLQKPVALDEQRASIDQWYKRIVLLALSEPYQITATDIQRLLGHLKTWGELCHLETVTTQSAADQCYLELESDTPPRRLRSRERWNNIRPLEGRIIKVDLLIQHLNHAVTQALHCNKDHQKNKLETRIERDFLLRVLGIWDQRKDRIAPRIEEEGSIQLAMGLTAIHQLLLPRKDKETREETKPSAAPSLHLMEVDEIELLTKGIITAIGEEPYADKPVQTAAPETSSTTGTVKALSSEWYIKDRSSTGLSLECSRDSCRITATNEEAPQRLTMETVASIRVGDLVAYRSSQESQAPWQIGDIRWLVRKESKRTSLGIRNLGDKATAARVSGLYGVGKGSQEIPALLLHNPEAKQQRLQILLSSGIYDVGSILEIQLNTEKKQVRLTRLLDTTPCFNLFEYRLPE